MTPVSHGKPCAGNPHARFDEGASAPANPRRNDLLHPAIKDAIDCMSTAERVQTMEYLWSVLSSYYDSEVPEWHANVLAERENAPEDEFEDWEDAKKELRGELVAH